MKKSLGTRRVSNSEKSVCLTDALSNTPWNHCVVRRYVNGEWVLPTILCLGAASAAVRGSGADDVLHSTYQAYYILLLVLSIAIIHDRTISIQAYSPMPRRTMGQDKDLYQATCSTLINFLSFAQLSLIREKMSALTLSLPFSKTECAPDHHSFIKSALFFQPFGFFFKSAMILCVLNVEI